MGNILENQTLQLLALIATLIGGVAAIDHFKEKYHKGRKFSLLSDLENVGIATYKLIFQPNKCFVKSKEGVIECSNLTAIRYWFYITLFSYIIQLFSSDNYENYSFYFFLLGFSYSIAKISFTVVAYYLAGLFLKKEEAYNLSSSTVFYAGLLALFLYTYTLIPDMYQMGLNNYIRNSDFFTTLGNNKVFHYFWLIVAYSYIHININNHFMFNHVKTLCFVVLGGLLYIPLKYAFVNPVGVYVQKILLDAPWAQ